MLVGATALVAWTAASLLALAPAPVVQGAPAAVASDADLGRRIEAAAEAELRRGPIAGIAVGVLRGGTTLFCGGFGFADLEHEVPVTERTFFRLASVTKQFTAAALLQQAEDGVLALDDPLSRHLPDVRTPGGDPTLLQLLNHTSGIRSLTSLPDYRPWRDAPRSAADVLRKIDGLPADFPPGEGFEYNNSAYILAGEIAANAGGLDYSALIEKRIFAPLGMQDSGYASERRLIPHRARGYGVADGKLVPAEPMNRDVPRGAGGLGSTAHDLLIWARALPALELVGDDSFARMTEPTRVGADVVDYGLGLQVGSHGGVAYFGHGGGIEGFSTWIEWLPEHELALVVLVNTEGNHAEPIAERLVRLLVPAEPVAAERSGAAPSDARDESAPPPLDPARAAACLGRYVGGELAVTIARTARGTKSEEGIRLTAQLAGQQPVPLRYRGERDGRLDFEIEPDPTQHLLLEPEARPPRATMLRPRGVRRLLRADG